MSTFECVAELRLLEPVGCLAQAVLRLPAGCTCDVLSAVQATVQAVVNDAELQGARRSPGGLQHACKLSQVADLPRQPLATKPSAEPLSRSSGWTMGSWSQLGPVEAAGWEAANPERHVALTFGGVS